MDIYIYIFIYKKVHNLAFAIISFATHEERLQALPLLTPTNIKLKNSDNMTAELYDHVPTLRDEDNRSRNDRNLKRKRGNDAEAEHDTRTPQEMINDQVTSLWR
jgi:hypothetical protein